jgi:lysophospholipase L1-like esterase
MSAYVGGAVAAAAAVGLIIASLSATTEPVQNAGAMPQQQFQAAPHKTIAPVAPLELPDDPAVLMFGDSFILGHGIENTRKPAYPEILADSMGWTNVRLNAVAGTGFAAASTEGPYPERLKAMGDDFTPDLVILQGSVNDIKPGIPAVRAGITDVLSQISTRWPSAQVVLITPMTGVLNYEALASAYKGPALGKAHVIDATGPESWLPLDKPELRTADTFHPSAPGHEAIAAGLQAALEAM